MGKAKSPLAKSEVVYRALREKIIAGHYSSGYRLVLGKIAKEAGMSPVPVREAIRRLEAEKLVTFTPNVGAQVADVDVEQYGMVMEVAAILEGGATAMAAPNLTEAQLLRAEEINEEMRRLTRVKFDPAEFTRLNREFHRQLWAGCPNKLLVDEVEDKWERIQLIRRNDFAFEPSNAPISVAEHEAIVQLIRGGAPAAEIDRAARDHKLRTRRVFAEQRSA